MPANSGYIYFWRDSDGVGRIRVCEGSFAGFDMTNSNVPFEQQDCDAALRKRLNGININRPRVCPPPNDALSVKFNFTLRNGVIFATDLSAI